jgi:hypothetical protein
MSARGKRRVVIILCSIAVSCAALLIFLNAVKDHINNEYCVVNLHQIAQACQIYAKEHQHSYPSGFENLIADDLSPVVLVCSASTDIPASGDTNQQRIADFAKPGHCSYIYCGAGLTTASPPTSLLAYEKLENHEKGIHVLHLDGTVEWLDRKAAQKLIAEHGHPK